MVDHAPAIVQGSAVEEHGDQRVGHSLSCCWYTRWRRVGREFLKKNEGKKLKNVSPPRARIHTGAWGFFATKHEDKVHGLFSKPNLGPDVSSFCETH